MPQPIPTQPIPTQPIPSTPIQDKEKDLAPIKEETLIKEMDQQQKSELEKSLMDLKIKKANLSKIALDYDMKELTGEITADELNEKTLPVLNKIRKLGFQVPALKPCRNPSFEPP